MSKNTAAVESEEENHLANGQETNYVAANQAANGQDSNNLNHVTRDQEKQVVSNGAPPTQADSLVKQGTLQDMFTDSDNMDMDDVEVEVRSPLSPALGQFSKILAVKTLAVKWRKKAIKKNHLNMAFSDSPHVPQVDACHAMYWTKRRSVPLKNYHDEARAEKDISKFLDNPVVLFKVKGQQWKDIAREMLENIKILKPSMALNVERAYSCLMSSAGDYTIPECVQGLVYNHDSDIICEQSFVVVLGSTPAVLETQTSFAVLKNSVNLGAQMSEVKMICMILSPVKSKQTKSGIEVGRTYTTLLSDLELRRRLLDSKSPAEFASIVKEGCTRVMDKHTELYKQEREMEHEEEVGDQTGSPVKNFFKSIMPPGKLLLNDIKRRKKHYLSDFTDGLDSWRSIKKYTTSVIFLYFTLLLPVMAFGVLNSYNTENEIETRKGILAQAFGGIIFALFAGQPLSVVQTTIPIVLFIKLVHTFSEDLFEVDFLTFYTLVGLWNGFFLVIYAFTGVSQIMAYCSRSTEEIVGIFTSIAFIVDSMKYVSKQFDAHWCDDGGDCKYPDRSVALAVFIVTFGTLFIAVQIYNFKWSPFLSSGKRKLVAEYALPFSVLVMSLIGSYFMKDVKLETFTDEKYEMKPVYSPFEYKAMKFYGCTEDDEGHKCKGIDAASFITSAALGFIVSMLFFVEANVAASMVNNPHNKLKKGSAYHLDMLTTAVINIILSVFGLPWMHACLPTSPMHVRGLADIEEKVELGYVKEIIVSVRETRLTTLIANILVFISLLLIPVPLEYIPIPALYGVLLFIAISSLSDFQLWERVLLLLTEQTLYPPIHYIRKVPQKAVHTFTALQLVQLGVLCALSFSGVPYLKMLFPFIIIALIPIRKFLIPKAIHEDHLEALDGSH